MAEKKFLSWVGFKEATPMAKAEGISSENSGTSTQSTVSRIRELENQLAELRARRDITSLTKEEFEILASETAMTLIKTAQSRESKAIATAQKAINESSHAVKEMLTSAEEQAKATLLQAESRGRKYIEAAEADAESKLTEALQTADQVIATKKREAAALFASAKKESEKLISNASSDVANYREWLSTAISEAERLHRVQVQSLSAAEQAITQTRGRLAAAFEKLSSLQVDIDVNLTPSNLPKSKTYVRSEEETETAESKPAAEIKVTKKKAASNKSIAKKTPVKKAAEKKVAKKSSAKRK